MKHSVQNKRSRLSVGPREWLAAFVVFLAAALAQTAGAVTATGGNITTNYLLNGTNYRAHIFTTVGITNLTVTSGGTADVLVVAGGGGAGGCVADAYGPGGGGAGGMVYTNAFTVTISNYTVMVGAGGAGGPAGNNYGANGSNSIFGPITAYGGGGGAGNDNGNAYTGRSGGAGGGGSRLAGLGGAGTNGQGYAGGKGNDSGGGYGGGGGGGSGGAGGDGSSTTGGAAGPGITNSISGTPTAYAMGGTGGWYSAATDGVNASPSTGNGGNGPKTQSGARAGGNGGSGIVIVRYASMSSPSVNNASGATSVTASSACLNGTLVDTGGAPATVSVCWGPTNGGASTTGWAHVETFPGYPTNTTAFTTNVTITASNIMHFYRYYATNDFGGSWADSSASFLPGSVWVTATTTNASESPGYPGVFTVSRPDTATNGDLTVYYTFSGAATNGVDYTAAASNVTILAGYSNATVTIAPILDMNPEPAKDVTLTLGPGLYVIGAPDHDTIWIQDSLVFTQTVVKTWTGSNNWNIATNWSPQGVPAQGDDVRISSGWVMLTNATPALYAFTLNSGTLVFSNWDTCIAASNVTLNSGTVTHPANTDSNAPWTPNARIRFICCGLTMAANCTMNAVGKGYQVGSNGGYGPGGGGDENIAGDHGPGGGYGGPGGNSDTPDARGVGGSMYGTADAPTDPGSAGSYGQGAGGAGGGAVRIDAVGDVTIDGNINTSGVNGSPNQAGGGSGGAVFINCRCFRGSGAILANAGNAPNTGYPGGGGGGRIAVLCDANQQLAVTPKPTVNFSARRGTGLYNGGLGTLYLSSMELLARGTLTGGGRIIVPGLQQWTWTNDLVSTNSELVLPTGLSVTVSNDLILSGTSAILTLTNVALTVGRDVSVTGTASALWVHCDTNTFAVGRNFSADNGGKIYVCAGMSNGLSPYYAALVNVGGDVTVGTNAYLCPCSQNTNGGSLKFAVRNVNVRAGGTVRAYGYILNTVTGSGYGPGGGKHSFGGSGHGSGAGHGGKGGDSDLVGGQPYGSSNAPVTCGSAGSYGTMGIGSMNGGGLVWIEASGQILVDGTIKADGDDAPSSTLHGGGGAGGGIHLRCRRLSGGGSLSARGGSTLFNSGNLGGGGGGGRVAVWRSYDSWTGTPAPTNNGTAVDGGTNAANAARNGGAGTIFWGLVPAAGTVLSLR